MTRELGLVGTVEKVGPVQDKGLYEQAKSFAVSANKGDVTAKHGEEDTKSEKTRYRFNHERARGIPPLRVSDR